MNDEYNIRHYAQEQERQLWQELQNRRIKVIQTSFGLYTSDEDAWKERKRRFSNSLAGYGGELQPIHDAIAVVDEILTMITDGTIYGPDTDTLRVLGIRNVWGLDQFESFWTNTRMLLKTAKLYRKLQNNPPDVTI